MLVSQIILTVIILNALYNFPQEVTGKHIPQFAGPWHAIIQRIENGTDFYKLPEHPQISGRVFFSPAKYNQKQYAWGHFFMAMPLSNELRAEVRNAKRSNNQWKNNAFVMKFDNACTNLLTHMRWIPDMLLGKGNYSTCPIPAVGLIEVTNKSVNPDFPAFPVFPYGIWRFTLGVFKGSFLLGATDANFETVPKM